MTEDQMIEKILAEVSDLNSALIEKGFATKFAVGFPNEAVIEWVSQRGPVTLYVCLNQNHALIESDAGSSYDMDVAQARENIFNSYL